MPAYSQDIRETMIQKMLSPGSPPIGRLAEQSGINVVTLYNWRRQCANPRATMAKKKKSGINQLTKLQMFEVLTEVVNLDEQKRGAYLRKHGLLNADLERFKKELTQEDNPSQVASLRLENRALKQEKKQQARELRRKDKALAEATAILVMKKKAELIWGKVEDDESD